MKALVVYESMFGNTEEVAHAVGKGLAAHLKVDVTEVAKARSPVTELVDLIVVGGPTHAFSMSRPESREEAVHRGATQGSTDIGIREWLASLRHGPHSERVATFDTRATRAKRLPGSAARKAARAVRKDGYPSAAKPESFFVEDTAGPLSPGELDRAVAWGDRLGAEAVARAQGLARP
jgi:hypothetical protein